MKKQTTTLHYLQEIVNFFLIFNYTLVVKTNIIKNKRMRKDRTSNHQKEAKVTILISDKADFRTRNITRDKEEHLILIRGLFIKST